MKKFLVAALCALGITAQAEVVPHRYDEINFELDYPKVVMQDSSVEARINESLTDYFQTIRHAFLHGNLYQVKGGYRVTYEDENLLSIHIDAYGTYKGGNGVVTFCRGLVYDKKTGRQLPLSYFLSAKVPYREFTYSTMGTFLDDGWNEIGAENTAMARKKLERIPDNYVLLGNGRIAIFYTKYELAAGVYGPVRIVLSGEEVEYLNRIHQS